MFCEIKVVEFALDLDVIKTNCLIVKETVSCGLDRIARFVSV